MRSMVIVIMSSFCFLQPLYSQWIPQESGTQENLNSVYFVNKDTGWVVGKHGTILHTSDGGSHWNPQSSGIDGDLYSVAFTDSINGIAVGYDSTGGAILRTQDGGEHWSYEFTEWPWNSICFVNESMGWISGNGGRILHTTDGGNNWTNQHTSYDFLDCIQFSDQSNGWAVGDITTLRTGNGGATWTSVQNPQSQSLNAVFFVNANIGWFAGNSGYLLYTEDGGEHFITQTTNTSSNLNAMYFINQLTGWVVGRVILKTTDGGESWVDQAPPLINRLNSIYFVDDTTGWAVGLAGTILKTDNGGVTSVKTESAVPKKFILEQNYPNPFNPATTIRYSIPERSHVRIDLFNSRGQRVKSLLSTEESAGTYRIRLDGSDLPSGEYLYRITAGEFTQSRKMILLK